MACNVKDCEDSAGIFFCPNRFSGDEMVNIKIALQMTHETMLAMREQFQQAAIQLPAELTLKDIDGEIADIEKLQKKVGNLIAQAAE